MSRIPEAFPGVTIPHADPRGTLLYDGDCGFCTRAAEKVRTPARLSFQQARAWLPPEAARTTPHQMLWIEPDGSIWGGSRALVKMLRRTGRPFLAALLGNPLMRPFTWLGYRLAARWRYRLGGPCWL